MYCAEQRREEKADARVRVTERVSIRVFACGIVRHKSKRGLPFVRLLGR